MVSRLMKRKLFSMPMKRKVVSYSTTMRSNSNTCYIDTRILYWRFRVHQRKNLKLFRHFLIKV